MELIDLPEIYGKVGHIPQRYYVSNAFIDKINESFSLVDSIKYQNNKSILLYINNGFSYEITHYNTSIPSLVVFSSEITISLGEDVFDRLYELKTLTRLPYDYFCYLYDDDRHLIENTLRKIFKNANN